MDVGMVSHQMSGRSIETAFVRREGGRRRLKLPTDLTSKCNITVFPTHVMLRFNLILLICFISAVTASILPTASSAEELIAEAEGESRETPTHNEIG
ncbi:unnamed protein product [Caenorhabditis auriculariae]|uniref:Transmembrane protein n=1 Tax=Caenorhabditis auriculariae TaxID=2777116 RepID=A0A8S1GPU3_9PELO|nr:unnamed protein product [Caenorhabditis auriculariae]